MPDRWDDRDRAERDRGWSEGRDRWPERESDYRGRRSILGGRTWDDDRDRNRDRGWTESRDRWPGDREDKNWERHREGGRSLTIGRGELTGEGRDDDRYRYDERNWGDDRSRWEGRSGFDDRRWREDDREWRRGRDENDRWATREGFVDRDRDRDRNYGTTGAAPSFTGAGGTWSAGHSGAAAHDAAGGMSAWSGRDRYEDRERRGIFAGRGPKNYRRADDRICEDVNERLTQHPEVDASDVEVTVHEGEVTLAGVVESRHERRVAEDAAWEIWGVREVHNNLKTQSRENRENRGVLDKVADAFRGDNR